METNLAEILHMDGHFAEVCFAFFVEFVGLYEEEIVSTPTVSTPTQVMRHDK